MDRLTRRGFLQAGLGTVALAGAAGVKPAWAQKRSATDLVTLGKSGIEVTRLAFGTGTFSGRTQAELGQDGFTRIVRYAYDKGIRFFETAEGYQTPPLLGNALKGLPRDSYRLMTKFGSYGARGGPDLATRIDRARTVMNQEYFDIALMHYMTSPAWRADTKGLQDGMDEAKSKKSILAHGASFHGLGPLSQAPGYTWLDVSLIRINHAGNRMDTANQQQDTAELGDVAAVSEHARKIHAQGTGVLGMKLMGEGQFTNPAQRQKSLDYVFKLGAVDAVTIGFKSTAEIDEAIERINSALNA